MADPIRVDIDPVKPTFTEDRADIRIADKPDTPPTTGDEAYTLGFFIGHGVKLSDQLQVLGDL